MGLVVVVAACSACLLCLFLLLALLSELVLGLLPGVSGSPSLPLPRPGVGGMVVLGAAPVLDWRLGLSPLR